MTLTSFTWTLEPLGLYVYGEDRVLTRDHRKASSQKKPGRIVNGEWSTLHEIGNRELLTEKHPESHSFVRNFFNHMVMQAMDSDSLGSSAYSAGNLGMKAIGGGLLAFAAPTDIGGAGVSGTGFRAGAGIATQGIQAGLGDGCGGATAFCFNQFALQLQVAEGTCACEMSHVAMDDYTASNVVYTGGCTRTWTTTYERFFNNNSGCTITIEEVALVFEEVVQQNQYMVARDVLGACALCIANTGQLKVTYTITSPQFPS